MLAGVNGAGKTTSIGKLAQAFQVQAIRCCSPPATLPRGRARAARRSGGAQRRHGDLAGGGDPAAVMFDAIARPRRAGSTSCWRTPRAGFPRSCTDGGDPQGAARDPQGRPGARTRRCSSSTPTPGRTRSRRSRRSTRRSAHRTRR
jgi:hypothetical protein